MNMRRSDRVKRHARADDRNGLLTEAFSKLGANVDVQGLPFRVSKRLSDRKCNCNEFDIGKFRLYAKIIQRHGDTQTLGSKDDDLFYIVVLCGTERGSQTLQQILAPLLEEVGDAGCKLLTHR